MDKKIWVLVASCLTFALSAVLIITNLPAVQAQDLLARQAPVDHRLKAVDSVSIKKLIVREGTSEEDLLSQDLYSDSWETRYVHAYGKMKTPDTYKIDLRGFAMPTPSRKITSRYGYRAQFHREHKGLDIKVYTGDTIMAAFDGKVRVVRYEANGYGKFVVIRHSNGLETVYGHLSKQLVSTNQIVKAGQPIGLGGNTGRSFGSHLHFETRLLGTPINPELLFDFPNQDVTGDFYVFNKRGGGKSVSNTAYYKVRKGDTVASIAKANGITEEELCKLNKGLDKDSELIDGQILRL